VRSPSSDASVQIARSDARAGGVGAHVEPGHRQHDVGVVSRETRARVGEQVRIVPARVRREETPVRVGSSLEQLGVAAEL
jgi:hypothetical protein